MHLTYCTIGDESSTGLVQLFPVVLRRGRDVWAKVGAGCDIAVMGVCYAVVMAGDAGREG